MFYLIPARLHRLALRIAHKLRHRFRGLAKPDLAGVAVLLENDAGQLLLVRHSYGPEGWGLPGGGMGHGEDPIEAARREIREELGCELADVKNAGVFEETVSGTRHTAHMFTARAVSEPVVDGRELVEARWLHAGELPSLRLTRYARRRLKQLGIYSSDN